MNEILDLNYSMLRLIQQKELKEQLKKANLNYSMLRLIHMLMKIMTKPM